MATSAPVLSPRKRRSGQRERLTLASITLAEDDPPAFDSRWIANVPAARTAVFKNARRLSSVSAAPSAAMADAPPARTTAPGRSGAIGEGDERDARGARVPSLLLRCWRGIRFTL